MLFVSHDRELLARTATQIVTVELGAAGNTTWTHGGGFATYHQARADRFARLEELRRRWDEEHQKLKDLVQMYKVKAKYNDGMASRYQAAKTRLAKFEEAGPPQEIAREQTVRMRLIGGRTGKRAVVCEQLELTGLMKPFDLEVWFGERVAVLGANGSGKSHFLRLLAAGGSDPDVEHRPVGEVPISPVSHTGVARLGARVRPGWFAQTHEHPELVGRTLLEVLHRGDDHRDGMGRELAARKLDRYELAHASEQTFETLSGGQQARFQILLLELSGATLLLLDEPTDNLDLASAEALEEGLAAFEGTVLAVTHDRWFARGFDRFVVFRADGTVRETDEPVWDESRPARPLRPRSRRRVTRAIWGLPARRVPWSACCARRRVLVTCGSSAAWVSGMASSTASRHHGPPAADAGRAESTSRRARDQVPLHAHVQPQGRRHHPRVVRHRRHRRRPRPPRHAGSDAAPWQAQAHLRPARRRR